MNFKMKKFGAIFALLITLALMSGFAHAASVPITISETKLDGTSLEGISNFLSVERNTDSTLKITMVATGNASNVVLTAFFSGYEYQDRESTSDSTHVFDVVAGGTYVKTLNLNLPQKLTQDKYKLRLLITDRDNDAISKTYELNIDTARKSLAIRDVVMSPETSVKAGRSLLVTVRAKNYGQKDEEAIKVNVAIPDLDVSASGYIDTLDKDASATSEELFLKIPTCAKAGTYDVKVSLQYDEGYERTSVMQKINVEEEESCKIAAVTSTPASEKTLITVAAQSQDVVKGESGATFTLTLTNSGSNAKTYVINADETSWATLKISPSNVIVLNAGESKPVFVYATAKDDASLGEKAFTVQVKQGDNLLKEVIFKGNVVEGKNSASSFSMGNLKNVLEIGLVVLILLLVILGLIIAFNKLKGNDEDEDDKKKYY